MGGKIATGFGLISDAEDFVGDQSDNVEELFKFMKKIFGGDTGKIAVGFNKIKDLIPGLLVKKV